MKKIYLLVFVLTFCQSIQTRAQAGDYTLGISSTTFIPITGGTLIRDGNSTMDSYTSPAISIPGFTFAGNVYSTVYMNSNGYITLGGNAPGGSANAAISSTVGSGIAIAAMAADLDRFATASPSAEMRWEQIADTIIFQWQDIRRYAVSGERFSIQIKLNTTNSEIQFIYGGANFSFGSSTSYQPQVGIRTSATDYKNITVGTGAETWAAPLPGTANSNVCRLTTAAPAKLPTQGLTYTWAPSNCSRPGIVRATEIAVITANASWSASTSASITGYRWELRTAGAPGTGATGRVSFGTATDTLVALTGLLANTGYTFYVSSNCGSSDTSNWAPVAFTTGTYSSLIYTESFATTSTPIGWNTTGWSIGSTRGVTGNPGNNIYKNLYTSAPTGVFTTNFMGIVTATTEFSFDYKLADYSSPYNPPAGSWGSFTIQVTNDFGANWTDIQTINDPAISGWVSKVVNLNAYAGDTIALRIIATWAAGDWDLAFDNLRVGTAPVCYSPTMLAVTAITNATAELTWMPPTSGTPANYYYEVRTTGAAGSGATGRVSFGTTNNMQLQ
jgi:hypothetical protein